MNAERKDMKMQSDVVGEGIPVVLVPGGLTGWLSWEPHSKVLSAKRRVIRVQLLNVQFGLENRALPSDYSVKTESRALASTLDALGYTMPLDLVAWSYGALLTLDYALDHPNRVRTLTLIEPPALWVLHAQGTLDRETGHIVRLLQTLQGDISEDQLETFLQNVGFLKPGQSARELPQWNLWARHRQSLRNSPAVIAHNDEVKRLHAFERPTLLVKGTGSARFLHRIIDRLAGAMPHSRVIEMPAGHAPQIVSMDNFLLEVERFQKASDE